jgi:hypothetical protein
MAQLVATGAVRHQQQRASALARWRIHGNLQRERAHALRLRGRGRGVPDQRQHGRGRVDAVEALHAHLGMGEEGQERGGQKGGGATKGDQGVCHGPQRAPPTPAAPRWRDGRMPGVAKPRPGSAKPR